MANFSKEILSGSVDGMGIVVTSVSGGTSGTAGTIHTATSSGKDEVWLWAANHGTADCSLCIEWGTAENPRVLDIPYRSGLIPVIPGLILQNAKKVQCFAGSSGLIVIDGFVNRITES